MPQQIDPQHAATDRANLARAQESYRRLLEAVQEHKRNRSAAAGYRDWLAVEYPDLDRAADAIAEDGTIEPGGLGDDVLEAITDQQTFRAIMQNRERAQQAAANAERERMRLERQKRREERERRREEERKDPGTT